MKIIVTTKAHLQQLLDDDNIVIMGLVIESPLSKRELDVISLMAQGYKNKDIADQLCISIRTVESHRARIYDKLEPVVRSREKLDIINIAKQLGLIGDQDD